MLRHVWYEERVPVPGQPDPLILRGDSPDTLRNLLYDLRNTAEQLAKRIDYEIQKGES